MFLNRQFSCGPPDLRDGITLHFAVQPVEPSGDRPKAKWLHPKMKGNSMPKGGPQENCRFKNVGLRAHYSGSIREILEPKRYHLKCDLPRAPGAAL